MSRRARNAGAWIVVAAGAAQVAWGACVHVVRGTPYGMEAQPCGGDCNNYITCLGSDACGSGGSSANCGCTAHTVTCKRFHAGRLLPSGCCTDGRPMNNPNTTTTVVIDRCTETGGCDSTGGPTPGES